MDYYNNQTYYDILGVTKDASLEKITNARYRLKYGSPDDRVPFSMWDKIDRAYDILSDVEKRREYDKSLENGKTDFDYTNDDISHPIESTDNLGQVGQKIEQPKVEPTLSQTEQVKENSEMVPTSNQQEIDVEEQSLQQPNDEKSKQNNELDSNVETQQTEEKKDDISNTSLKNDIFEKLRFKPTEESKFKDVDSIMAGKNAKTIGKYVASGALTFAVLGPYGVGLLVVGYLINKKVRKKVKKAKLTKESYTGIITDIQTIESKLIEESNQKLMSNIDKLLEGNHKDVELQKQKLNYINQVELLEKMIEVRKNTRKEKGQLTRCELRILALEVQLYKAKRDLKYIEKNEKRNELVDNIGVENINFDSRIMKNLTIGNKYLQLKNTFQKIKLQGGAYKSAKNFLLSKLVVPEELKQEIREEQQSRYR